VHCKLVTTGFLDGSRHLRMQLETHRRDEERGGHLVAPDRIEHALQANSRSVLAAREPPIDAVAGPPRPPASVGVSLSTSKESITTTRAPFGQLTGLRLLPARTRSMICLTCGGVSRQAGPVRPGPGHQAGKRNSNRVRFHSASLFTYSASCW
jgi:hypothetical protein